MAVTLIYTGGTHSFTLPSGITTMEYLVVAGGGSGGVGGSVHAGGGGAGGYKAGTITNPIAGTYTIIVGSGGNSVSNSDSIGLKGNDSSISGTSLNVKSYGGGFGNAFHGVGAGGAGGSGGGGSHNGAYNINGGTATPSGQGNNGGNGKYPNGTAGGGGGSSSVGIAGGNSASGVGGNGTSNSITGSAIIYAKGGDGGTSKVDGAANTGNGGTGSNSSGIASGKGGSGIIVIKYSSVPVVITKSISGITETTAQSGADVTGSGILQKGLCWGITSNPTTGNTFTNNGSGIGTFYVTLTGLSQNNTYYVRAYAINSDGIAYGNEQTFSIPITAPRLTGGTDVGLFPNLGWSGITQVCTWTQATHQRWYHKISTGSTYTLVAALGVATGNTYQHLGLLPNVSYSFYSTFYKTGTESSASNVITINNTVAAPVVTYSSILIV